MGTITINGRQCEFQDGQLILQVALDHEIEIPHYCYHPSLSVVANCRICLAEVWAPNPRADGKLEPMPKLMPTCQTPAGDGQVVHINSPKAIANQKAVMEYLLINHPVDCAVCDQAGECHLQDYSYQYGRGQARFQEQKIKQPKKKLGEHVLLYSDRCIMCTRCVRFTREITGTGELMVDGRGAYEQIDVFPGVALDNELSGNVIDICPVGALLDNDFLFQQRVWYLTSTPSIDGLTCSGDNISVEHNKGIVYRIKPRANLEVNRYWITDELRYGWKFVHNEHRITMPSVRGEDPFEQLEAPIAYEAAYARAGELLSQSQRIAVMISPMLSCEDAYLIGKLIQQLGVDALIGIGPVPFSGEDKTFRDGFKMYAEKAPNARGVRRVLEALFPEVHDHADFIAKITRSKTIDTVLLTGNYPSDWVTPQIQKAVDGRALILIDTLATSLANTADVVIPSATWMEKSGTFENVNNRLQAFERAIEPIDYCKSESQIALDMLAMLTGEDQPQRLNAANVRMRMATEDELIAFTAEVHMPAGEEPVDSDMQLVEL